MLSVVRRSMAFVGACVLLFAAALIAVPAAHAVSDEITTDDGIKYVLVDETDIGYNCGAGAYVQAYTGSGSLTVPAKLGGVDVVSIDLGWAIGDSTIKSINVEKCGALQSLCIAKCTFTSIDLSKNTKLKTLLINNKALTSIDVSKNANLKGLFLQAKKLKTLNVSSNKKLEDLSVECSKIKKLDLSSNTKLDYVELEQNAKLTSVVFGKNSKLEYINVQDNALEEVSISGLSGLKYFYGYGNNFNAKTKLTLKKWLKEKGHYGSITKYAPDDN